MSSSPKTSPPALESLFKQAIIISTALSIAVMYGWLAGFETEADGGFRFHWCWPQIIWTVIGYLSTAYFWHKAWPAKRHAAAGRRDIFKATVVFAVPFLWWATLPLRLDSGPDLKDVITGVIAAVIVLSFVGWMLFRLFKAFEDTDKYDLEHLDNKSDKDDGH